MVTRDVHRSSRLMYPAPYHLICLILYLSVKINCGCRLYLLFCARAYNMTKATKKLASHDYNKIINTI